MIEVTVYEIATGRFKSQLTLFDQAEVEANTPALHTSIAGHYDVQLEWFDLVSGAVALRPSLPAVANPYDVTGFPAETEISIKDDLGSVTPVTDLSSPIEFEDAGTYEVIVRPPFP